MELGQKKKRETLKCMRCTHVVASLGLKCVGLKLNCAVPPEAQQPLYSGYGLRSFKSPIVPNKHFFASWVCKVLFPAKQVCLCLMLQSVHEAILLLEVEAKPWTQLLTVL